MTAAWLDRHKRALDEQLDREILGLDGAGRRELAVMRRAVGRFRTAGPDILDSLGEHVWAYYLDTVDAVDAMGWDPFGVPVLAGPADALTVVDFGTGGAEVRLGHRPLGPARTYLSFEGEVAWEPEHGLQIVFANGTELCKVGPYDGHMTNAHARNDPTLLNVVYAGTTRRTTREPSRRKRRIWRLHG